MAQHAPTRLRPVAGSSRVAWHERLPLFHLVGGESLTLDELVAFLRDKIATYKLPEFLHLLDALPRTPTGKVQKGRLRDIVMKGMASV